MTLLIHTMGPQYLTFDCAQCDGGEIIAMPSSWHPPPPDEGLAPTLPPPPPHKIKSLRLSSATGSRASEFFSIASECIKS